MPRRARLDSPGTLHHVIVRGIEKRKIVNDNQDRGKFIERLGALSLSTQTAIYAWALMTNHAHLLLRSGQQGDDRILGGGAFVSQMIDETELSKKYRLANLDREKAANALVEKCCHENSISRQAFIGGSRVREVSKLRSELACRLIEELGLSFAEIARLLGVSTSAITKIYQRKNF